MNINELNAFLDEFDWFAVTEDGKVRIYSWGTQAPVVSRSFNSPDSAYNFLYEKYRHNLRQEEKEIRHGQVKLGRAVSRISKRQRRRIR